MGRKEISVNGRSEQAAKNYYGKWDEQVARQGSWQETDSAPFLYPPPSLSFPLFLCPPLSPQEVGSGERETIDVWLIQT